VQTQYTTHVGEDCRHNKTAAKKLIIFGDDESMLENKYNNNLNNFINIDLLNKHNPIN
jgi:hypothetical protein